MNNDKEKKSWGQDINRKFQKLGLSRLEVQAWWGMRVKHSISPELWCTLVRSDIRLDICLRAEASWVFEKAGMSFLANYKLTRDVVIALATLKKVTQASDEVYEEFTHITKPTIKQSDLQTLQSKFATER